MKTAADARRLELPGGLTLPVTGHGVEVTNQDAENIRALARIAAARERRIENLEQGQ